MRMPGHEPLGNAWRVIPSARASWIGQGPNLHGIMGKPVAGGSARYGYTAALERVGGHWDRATMNRWLTSPQRFAPGTKMTFEGLPDPLARADVIAYLEREGRQ